MTFKDYSETIAKEFLQSAIFVDDKAEFRENESEVLEVEEPTEKDALELSEAREGSSNSISKEIKDAVTDEIKIDMERLNAKKVIDVFSENGIICSIFKPQKDEENLIRNILIVSKKTDIMVFDWNLNNDNGMTCLELIDNILKEDKNQRLRLIIIYTGENVTVIDEISKSIKDKSGLEFIEKNEGYCLEIGYTRIVIFGKKGVSSKFDVDIEDLPKRIIEQFSEIYSGLIPNLALKCISALRGNTHELLSILNPNMDPPFLSHRLLLHQPEEAEDHIIDIISSEINSLLKNYNVGSTISNDKIDIWLDDNIFIFSKKLAIIGKDKLEEVKIPEELTKEIIMNWMKKGLINILISKEITNVNDKIIIHENCHKELTQLFCNEDQEGSTLDKNFALLTSVKPFCDNILPTLSLGTIIRDKESIERSNYWLCIQPKCDSIRINNTRLFQFIKLEKNNDSFDIVVKDLDEYVLLKINYSLFNSIQKLFKAKNGMVEAEKDENNLYFQVRDDGRYFWVCELKDIFSQRIINNLSANLSRVGLDESEWLRRNSKN